MYFCGHLKLLADLTSEILGNAIPNGDPSSRETSNAGSCLDIGNIKHQLRLIFIYPLVYFLLLVPPFLNHFWVYTKDYPPPLAFTTIAVICLAEQGAVDCVIFMSREKPWRLLKLQSNPSRKDNDFCRERVHSDCMELAPVRIKMKPTGIKGPEEPREWREQELYSLEDAASEGSRAWNVG